MNSRIADAPVIDIFIRSYYRDLRWLQLALRSITAFVVGYRRIVVVVPRSTLYRVAMGKVAGDSPAEVFECGDFTDDYLGQQLTKLHADLYTDADVVLHLDSDQLFFTQCDLNTRLFRESKLLMEFDSRNQRPRSDGWRRCPEVFFFQDIAVNLGVPLPLAVPRHVYAAIRRYCKEVHGMSLIDYAMDHGADCFSELALFRGYVWVHEFNHFTWTDNPPQGLIPECRTFWSRADSVTAAAEFLSTQLNSQVREHG
jgi:hypothetical protein